MYRKLPQVRATDNVSRLANLLLRSEVAHANSFSHYWSPALEHSIYLSSFANACSVGNLALCNRLQTMQNLYFPGKQSSIRNCAEKYHAKDLAYVRTLHKSPPFGHKSFGSTVRFRSKV